MIATMLGIWLAMLLARTTPTGRWMRRVLVAAPAAWLSKWSRGQVLLAALALVLAIVAILMFDGEAWLVFGMMAPEVAAWAAMFEISVYLDALIAVAMTASTFRSSAVRAWVAVKLMPILRGNARRAARTRRVRRPRPPANDDADGGAIPLAA